MKQVLNVGIGGRSFVIDEDAFDRLNSYLNAFRSKTGMGYQTKEVMDDLEMRIAEIFSESLSSRQEVVDICLVERVISQLGMPDGSDIPGNTGYSGTGSTADSGEYWHSGRDSPQRHRRCGFRPGLLLRCGRAGHTYPLRNPLSLRVFRRLDLHHPLDRRPGGPHQRGEMPDARYPGHGREYAQILQH